MSPIRERPAPGTAPGPSEAVRTAAGGVVWRPIVDPRSAELHTLPESLPAVPPEQLAPTELRRRFRQPPRWQPELTGDRVRLSNQPARAAAVLIAVVARETPTILLTERTAHLKMHAGQVAFPGGRTEATDASPEATALREAHEEIGLAAEFVEPIGRLPDYRTGTGFEVTPVVALVDPSHSLVIDANEVAEAFEVPISFLMDPANHQRRIYRWDDIERTFYAMPYRPGERPDREYFIWGATAAMLRNLYRFLSA